MSLRAKTWTYHGQHCFRPCNASRRGEMCQCKFDRSKAGQMQKNKMKELKEEIDAAKKEDNSPVV